MLMICKILKVWNGIGKLNDIGKMKVLKIGQFNQTWQMLEEKAFMQKRKYNYKGLDVA